MSAAGILSLAVAIEMINNDSKKNIIKTRTTRIPVCSPGTNKSTPNIQPGHVGKCVIETLHINSLSGVCCLSSNTGPPVVLFFDHGNCSNQS